MESKNRLSSWALACCSALFLCTFAGGCLTFSSKTTAASERRTADGQNERSHETEEAADGKDKGDRQGELEDLKEKEAEHRRGLAKLERDLAVATMKIERSRLDQAHTAVEQAVAVGTAEKELTLEQKRLRKFQERDAPNRIERARLDLTRAEDNTQEAEEELRQLELMYAEEDFADQTKEIVLDRGRRRLERARRDLELRRQELAILTEETIPIETTEHQMRVEKKTADMETARRQAEVALLDKEIALRSAESELQRLEEETEALHEKLEDTQAKREKLGGSKEPNE